MRLWVLILLSVALFLPVPISLWRDALDGPKGEQCVDGLCHLSAPETFMPFMQDQPFAKAQQIEQQNAERREKHKTCEHGGDFQPIARFNNAPGQTGAGTGSGDKFGHYCAD